MFVVNDKDIDVVLDMLPAEHQVVLSRIITHLRRVCHDVHSDESAAVARVSRVFGDILLHPPWTGIM